jgi:ABC-2 type transport system ATP-binding protein
MLKLKRIKKIFKSDLLAQPFTALDDVSFEIPKGALVGFLGANGAGKTTSLKIIMDFIRPDSGEVEFSPDMGQTKMDIFRKIGFLPERPYFYPNLTGEEFLTMLGKLSETPSAELLSRIRYWTPRFSIEHALKRPLKTYSKGMLQRIGFLATIIHDPELIILDEPLSGLDPVGRKEMKDVISEVHKKGKTVFFSSHVVPDIEEICDRVIFLEKGKLVYDGSVQSLVHNSPDSNFSIKVRGNPELIKQLADQAGALLDLDIGSGYHVLRVSPAIKQSTLAILIEKSIDIVAIEMEKLTLEEIFYKIKNKI